MGVGAFPGGGVLGETMLGSLQGWAERRAAAYQPDGPSGVSHFPLLPNSDSSAC